MQEFQDFQANECTVWNLIKASKLFLKTSMPSDFVIFVTKPTNRTHSAMLTGLKILKRHTSIRIKSANLRK